MDEQMFDRLIEKARAEGALHEKVEAAERRLNVINGDTAEIKRVARATDLKVAALAGSHSILLKLAIVLTGTGLANVVLNILSTLH